MFAAAWRAWLTGGIALILASSQAAVYGAGAGLLVTLRCSSWPGSA